jgi:hypothetical protein
MRDLGDGASTRKQPVRFGAGYQISLTPQLDLMESVMLAA